MIKSQMYQDLSKIFDPIKVQKIFSELTEVERYRDKGGGERGFGISCLLKDIDNNVMSQTLTII